MRGNSQTAQNFEGLQTRRKKVGSYCVSIGDDGTDLTSAYIVEFGENAFALRYAQGATPGIQSRDNGLVKATALDGGYYWAMSRSLKMSFGISIRQERALWRICNIDAMATTIDDLLSAVIRAKNKLPSKGRGAFMYVNSDLQSRIEIGILNKATNLRTQEVENYGPCLFFSNVAILPMDVIETGETEVT